MALLNFMHDIHNKTNRDYLQRVNDFEKAACSEVAKKFGFDYWDGERQFGYGGYKYDGRWSALAKNLITHFNLRNGDKILDIGCGKGYLLYELRKILPELITVGLDISEYAIENSKAEIASDIILGNASMLPFNNNEFDAVFSIVTLHNLKLDKLFSSISEINRVSKLNNNYIVVESWRSEKERENMLYWQLTCESFFPVDTWEWIFQENGYLGEWDFIFFEYEPTQF